MMNNKDNTLAINGFELDLNEPQVMGILNVTQDSFSDGGRYYSVDAALAQAERMLEEGASIIDIGGESTRPGAEPVSTEDELAKVIPVIEHLANKKAPISIDTSKPEVMAAAVHAGAGLINDVCALRQPGAIEMAASLEVPVCLMHMQGTPRTMQQQPSYDDVVEDIASFLKERVDAYEQACAELTKQPQTLILDPGFGFGKTLEHNFSLLRHLGAFKKLGYPILAGISRKSMIGAVIDKPPEQRVSASVACAILAWQQGASILRVHDVAETVDALKMVRAVERSNFTD